MDQNNEKLVSIICPCYNHEEFVVDLLDSLLEQTYNNIELFITDDHSADNSFEIIKNYEGRLKERFANVVIELNENNLGVVKTTNNMIKKSKGDYVKIIASDDFLDKNYIRKCVDFLELNTQYNFMFTDFYFVSRGSTYKNIKFIEKSNLAFYKDKNYYNELYNSCWLPAPSAFFRKLIFDVYGLYDDRFIIEDYPKWLQLMLKETPGFLYEHLVYYRVLEKSLSHCVNRISIEASNKHINWWLYAIETYDMYVTDEKCKSNGSIDKLWRCYMYAILGSNYSAFKRIYNVQKIHNIKVPLRKYLGLIKVFVKKVML